MNSILLLILSLLHFVNCGPPPTLQLNDGRSIPGIALGTWLGITPQGTRVQPTGVEVEEAVVWAIEAGYRHIDTAHIYQVEEQVGRGIARKISDGTVKREDLFITSKLWNDRHVQDQVVPGLRESLRKLQLDYLDLYLIHWPVAQFDNGTYSLTDYTETWRGMQEARRLGLTKSIGVSNFNVQQLTRILALNGVKPAVLQVEVNLNLQQPRLLAFAKQHDIVVMGYTPFGSLFPSKAAPGAPPPRVEDEDMRRIAEKYNKTVPQIALRYLVEIGVIPIPKSITRSRIGQNFNIFDFHLSEEDKLKLKSYDRNYRTITLMRMRDSPYYPFVEDSVTKKE